MDWNRYRETMALEESGRAEEALSKLKDLIGTSTDPVDNHLIFIGIASCLSTLHRYDQARQYVAKSYAILGKDSYYYPSAMFFEASIDEEVGDYTLSLAQLDSIIEHYPAVLTSPEYDDLKVKILSLRGIVLTGLERYKEARPLLEMAVAKDCGRERTLFYLGLCCYYLGDFPRAVTYLTEVLPINLQPQYLLLTHYYLAMAYLWQEKNAWARKEFEWCLQHLDAGRVRRDYVLRGLVKASEALGLENDAERYSKMLTG